ncbi:inactive beta-amylase 4, chloroplastic-like isoform X7 [Durio zibethinus]|uniref:Beta-amylase n=1 Tax=Durio zibethinus TaxID=66656 RepID=A0A6P5XXP9_DURZI|nr:inactive beta-amylase 4, chloroplastic-like isoform X7 [Durio zibethinus]
MACKCGGCYYTLNAKVSFDRDSMKNRNFLLRNVSVIRMFTNGFFRSKWRSVAGNRRIISMDAREKSRSTILESSKDKRVPIFVMMPVDAFSFDASGRPRIRKIKALTVSLKALKLAGVHGIGVEVWWGIVERSSPFDYSWSLYEELFKLISDSGLKLHVALSFHSNIHSSNGKGGVSLPLWILEIGDVNKDIYYRDQHGFSNNDYLTLGVDQVPLLSGRTALQCYEDFMVSFVDKFESYIGSVIEEISIGLGPSGELRYPAHPFGDGRWKFPGIGEFQCYDKYMMKDLKMAACRERKPQWGDRGPQNAGCYNSLPSGVPFFEEGQESFLSDYGRFFLEWYSGRLICHADAILAKAAKILNKYQENEQTSVMDGYDPVVSVFSRHGAALHIPCLDMMDSETPPTYLCSPEGLLKQIQSVSKKRIIKLIGRNTTERHDKSGLRRIHSNCYNRQTEVVRSFTYFRMNDGIFRVENWNNFVPFVRLMSRDL